MSHPRLVQDYVRAKWRDPREGFNPETIGRRLPAELKERIDELGLDDQLLLEVEPARVMERLEELETEILNEDLCNAVQPR